MNTVDQTAFCVHKDSAFFREAIGFTAATTGFSPRLIEKDYFCSLLLARLMSNESSDLVFKGGTCLAKIHAEFYRMSEDLDFLIPVATDCSRSARRQKTSDVKGRFATLPNLEPCFEVERPLTGANESRQYLGSVTYQSQTRSKREQVKIEVALREPLLTPAEQGSARTCLLDPISAAPLEPSIPITCISLIEAYAEKFRAALTRREVAIRDFFDIDFGVRELGILPDDDEMVDLVGQKLAIPGNGPIDISSARLDSLTRQIDSRLKPVLRQADFDAFHPQRAIEFVVQLATRLRSRSET